MVASGLTIVSRSTLTDKIQFMALCISALMEVYACTWPSDYLKDTSTNVAQAIYESLWYNHDKIFQKNLNFVLLRSQTPTTVSVSILPALSLQFYASNVTFEMIQFCDLMKLHEEIVIQRYIDKCIIFHGTSIFIFYWLTFTAITVMPTLEHQPFPTAAEYPFDVSYQPLKAIIFIQQSIAGIIVAGQLCVNVYMALLLWFASARFEMLTKELEKTTNVYQLFKCIKKHQKLLKYAKEVTICVGPFAFITICCSSVGLIVIFLLFISHQPILLIFQFFGMSIIGISEVFMYTWPAEHLMYTSKYVAETAFHMLENNHLIKMWKCLQIIIMRSQKPVTVSIPCFLPILSLNYFTSYLSTILSYFTSLRVMMDNDNN
ncbi:PREDICTED: odorant receptor 67c-like [Acromyrmex echinatior]|uniref:odorant receptor 67c-like n=1 Tax=Acromyrmex echinatior TaxID=103372 RepID=UPI000581063A|nr:PREDICTED: odorant receptor 67c-like [Acromyrmex echinatior]